MYYFRSEITSISTRTYKFRLYPTTQQRKRLQDNFNACRWVYNHFVKSAQNNLLSRIDMNYMLTELKQSEPWLYQYHAKMLQMVSTKLVGAQKALIQLRKNGYPTGKLRFVGYDQYHTFTYNQSGYEITKHGNTELLWLSKIGFIEIRKHKQILGSIKQIIISESKSGKWYACVTCDIDVELPKINLSKSVGLDVGIKNFVYDSDGFATPNPLNLTKLLRPIARVQRKMSRRQKGSNNHKKAVRFYQRIHERIANRRKDFCHNISTQYAKKYDVIFVERLAKLNMVKNHKLAQKILDSGWGILTNMLDYKCMLVWVPAKNTTIDCSRCGNMVPKSLAVRIHRCGVCGLVLDRDYNASLNILHRGVRIFGLSDISSKYQLPQELREVTPVEISQRSMKQEDAGRHLPASSHRQLGHVFRC